jgi:hypothetical protein
MSPYDSVYYLLIFIAESLFPQRGDVLYLVLNTSLYPWATRYLGSNYGLRLTLNLNIDKYVGEFAPRVGARVTVHHPATVPHPETAGFSVMPGSETAVGIRATNVQRMPAPFDSNCSNDFPKA